MRNPRQSRGLSLPIVSQPPALPGVSAPKIIGYFARICEDKGLHCLVEACELLATAKRFATVRIVRAAGYLGEGDRPYLKKLEASAAAGALAGRFRYLGELDRLKRLRFCSRLIF